MTTTRQQLEAWLLEDPKRGYRKAAKQFGVSVAQATEWGKAARGAAPSRTRTRKEPAADPPAKRENWEKQSRGDFLREQIAEVRVDLQAARDKQSTIAVEKTRRLLLQLTQEYEAWKKDNAAELAESVSEDELLEELATIMRDLPVSQLEVLHEVIMVRIGLKVA